jgi:hypothetical protein
MLVMVINGISTVRSNNLHNNKPMHTRIQKNCHCSILHLGIGVTWTHSKELCHANGKVSEGSIGCDNVATD